MSKIQTSLEKIFQNNRIVFWYDPSDKLDFEFSYNFFVPQGLCALFYSASINFLS